MASEKLDEKAIFNVARQIDSPEARRQYLHQVCGSDGNLRARVETLIREYEGAASFLESPPVGGASAATEQLVTEKIGTVIGRYKLMEEIGEGGMGVVYVAEQTEPVRRTVALKIIKPGMDFRTRGRLIGFGPLVCNVSRSGLLAARLSRSTAFTQSIRDPAMKFPMIQADDRGQTSFGVREIPDQAVPFGPPPNPAGLKTDFGAVESMFAFSVPAGTDVPAHNAPQPYICIVLSGKGEVLTSDGDKRALGPGDVLFCDDLTGEGHVTRAITDVVAAFINRAGS